MLINDVPVFAPNAPFGGPLEIDTSVRLNAAFKPGRNSIAVSLRMLPGSESGRTPFFRMDMGHWLVLDNPSSMDGRAMAVRMRVEFKSPGDGKEEEQILSAIVSANL